MWEACKRYSALTALKISACLQLEVRCHCCSLLTFHCCQLHSCHSLQLEEQLVSVAGPAGGLEGACALFPTHFSPLSLTYCHSLFTTVLTADYCHSLQLEEQLVSVAGPAGGLEGARVRHQQMVEAVEQARMLKAKVGIPFFCWAVCSFSLCLWQARTRHQQMVEAVEQARMLKAKVGGCICYAE